MKTYDLANPGNNLDFEDLEDLEFWYEEFGRCQCEQCFELYGSLEYRWQCLEKAVERLITL